MPKSSVKADNYSHLTPLEILELGVKHLLEQNEVSNNSKDSPCLYRGPSGLMCGAGVFIPDNYIEYFEYTSISRFAHKLGYDTKQTIVLAKLQYMHDIIPSDKWKEYAETLKSTLSNEGVI